MDEQRTREVLERFQLMIERIYLENQNDPEYDIPLAGFVIKDNPGDVSKVKLEPMPPIEDKYLLTHLLRRAVEDPNFPMKFDAIAMLFAMWIKDPESHERTGEEGVMVSIETRSGFAGYLQFQVTRAYGQTHLIYKHMSVEVGPSPDPKKRGHMQGFFLPTTEEGT